MVITIADELKRIAKGEVLSDDWSRKIYSVDASHYSIKPSVIVYPLDEFDLSDICQYGYSKNISMTARGAGTGLLGQSLNDSIIIDFTKYMNKIVEIESDYVIVQPGLVKGVLDKELEKKGKFFPPDPASSNYCTIGGMMANNSSGIHALGYGSTIDFLDMVNVVYSDGDMASIDSSTIINSYDADASGEKISKLQKLLSYNMDLLLRGYPKVTKNSCGYRLDSVINDKKFCPQKIFAASEGTLGFVTSAKIKIMDIPLHKSVIVFGFKNLLDAMYFVPLILQFMPVALEMLDHTLVSNIDTGDRYRNKDKNTSGCLLFVEFAGDNLFDIEQKLSACISKLSSKCVILESVFDTNSSKKIWQARKSALNNVMKLTMGSRKPLGLIEDTVVSPNVLYDYTNFLLQKYNEYNLDYVIYGHAGNGNLHTRPIIDTKSHKELEILDSIADEVFKKVISYGGTVSGEHGDGIGRTKYIETMYGLPIVAIFKQIKKIFDPTYVMNPGKKVIKV
jgi:FAD/FMN-containing dehydrogenase